MTEFIRLQECFPKNGLQFQLIERTELVGLYGTYLAGVFCGFELVRIYRTPVREYITSNARFGLDGSKCFFSTEPKRARKSYDELVEKMNSLCQGSTPTEKDQTVKESECFEGKPPYDLQKTILDHSKLPPEG